MKIILTALSCLCLLSNCSKKEKNSVFFIEPKNGETLTSPISLEFGVTGKTVEPAGEAKIDSGHHHLIINGESIKKGHVIPGNDTHIHYGGGQTEAEIELKPGKYNLTLQFANGEHASFGKQMSTSITITVEKEE